MLDIDRLLAELSSLSAETHSMFSHVAQRIAAGFVPNKVESLALYDVLAELQENYAALQQATEDFLPLGEARPPAGSPIAAYREAFAAEKSRALQRQRSEMEHILRRFVAVRAKDDSYAQALLPFQMEAETLLPELSGSDAAALDATHAVDAWSPFLRALAMQNFDTAAAQELLDELADLYPTKVVVGLTLRKYTLPEDEGDKAPVIAPAKEVEAEGELAEHVPEVEETPQAAVPVPRQKETRLETSPQGDAPPIAADAAPSILVRASLKIKKAAPSASAFKRDLQGRHPMLRALLPILTHVAVLDAQMSLHFFACLKYDEFASCSEEELMQQVKTLATKNILAIYESEELERPAFCLTAYGHDCLQKETVIKQMAWRGTFGRNRFCGADELPLASLQAALTQNHMLISCLQQFQGLLPENMYDRLTATLRCEKTGYRVFLHGESGSHGFLLKDTLTGPIQQGDENVLLLVDTLPDLSDVEIYPENMCVALSDGTLFRWSDGWGIMLEPMSEENWDDLDDLDDIDDLDNLDETEDTPALAEDTPENTPQPEAQKSGPPAPAPQEERASTVETAQRPTLGKAAKPEESTPAAAPQASAQPAAAPEPAEAAPAPTPEDVFKGDIQTICRALLDQTLAPTDEVFAILIERLLGEQALEADGLEAYDHLTQALLLAKTASFYAENETCQALYAQLLLATNLPLGPREYSSASLSVVFADPTAYSEAAALAAYCFALLAPDQKYDYALQSTAKQQLLHYESHFPSYEGVKPLFHTLCGIQDVWPEGFSPAVVRRLGNAASHAAYLQQLRTRAEPLLREPTIKAKMNGLPELTSACFGLSSDLHLCVEYVAQDKRAEEALVRDLLSSFCDDRQDGYFIAASKIDAEIDKQWAEATKNKKTHGVPLKHHARKQIFDAFEQRLSHMKSWLEWIALEEGTISANLSALEQLKEEILLKIEEVTPGVQAVPCEKLPALVLWMLQSMREHLSSAEWPVRPFAAFLRSGIISLDEAGIPILDETQSYIRYYEPWRNVLRHISAPRCSIVEARDAILDGKSASYDNLQQRKLIGQYFPDQCPDEHVSDQQALDAKKSAEVGTRRFREKLELAYTYGRIGENDKETIATLLSQQEERFFERQEFGCWRQFLNALDQQVEELTLSSARRLRKEWQRHLDSCQEESIPPLLKKAGELLEEGSPNFAVAEEYLNRFDAGELDVNIAGGGAERFLDFMSDPVFEKLYRLCDNNRERGIRSFGVDYVEKNHPRDWTARLIDDGKKLLSDWPGRRDTATTGQITNLFRGLGMDAQRVERVSGTKEEHYRLSLGRTARDLADYNHPIAAFGTQAQSSVNVIVLYGGRNAQQIVDTVTAMNLGRLSIVLIDYALDRATRRQVAEQFHTQTSGQNSFLLIDRVLALYLALLQKTERLPALLMCTLPFTSYQPFVRDGGSTADEMFCGRANELKDITDPNGACVVYGGRQLGKTALLERAQSLCTKPEAGAYAVYSTIVHIEDEKALVEKIIEDIIAKTPLPFTPCDTIAALCRQIDGLFNSNRVSSLLLLLDEVDGFLEAISSNDYKQLQPLVDLRRKTQNRFKFVLAGLHNVCRAKNATSRNGVFGQMGTPLCVKPLSPTDAMELISKPLRYLGFQFAQNLHLETILTNTNYYPGILQFFGYTLVLNLTGHQYKDYYRASANNPPFTLQDEQLGAIMNSADLNRSIKDKFRWSLELDPRYFMLARCIAMLFYLAQGETREQPLGYTVEEISDLARELEILCLEEETSYSCVNLLNEMVDMGILSCQESKYYRLRRHSFMNIIGTDADALLEDIVANNTEVAS